MTRKILIIEPNIEITKILYDLLTEEHYEVLSALDGETGLKMALLQPVDAILLELLLPQKNGLELIQSIRVQSNVPIIVLTESEKNLDRRLAFKLGADEYLLKPCDPQELIERLNAILRRTTTSLLTANRPTITYDGIVVDCSKRSVSLHQKQLELTNTEFNILETLIKSKGQAFSKEELTEYALGRKFTAYDRSIDVHISNLRNKLGNNAKGEPWVKTVRGFGYMFNN